MEFANIVESKKKYTNSNFLFINYQQKKNRKVVKVYRTKFLVCR